MQIPADTSRRRDSSTKTPKKKAVRGPTATESKEMQKAMKMKKEASKEMKKHMKAGARLMDLCATRKLALRIAKKMTWEDQKAKLFQFALLELREVFGVEADGAVPGGVISGSHSPSRLSSS